MCPGRGTDRWNALELGATGHLAQHLKLGGSQASLIVGPVDCLAVMKVLPRGSGERSSRSVGGNSAKATPTSLGIKAS